MNVVYLNGARCERLDVVSLYNPTFLYGINCFEGVRAYWNSETSRLGYLDLDAHLDRLYQSMDRLSFPSPVPLRSMRDEICRVALAENIQEDVYIRITMFIGEGASWHSSDAIHWMISMRSLPSLLGRRAPARVSISTVRRVSSAAMPASVKAGANYLNSRYAMLEARGLGFDDALFLTASDLVSEATGSSIFFVKDRALYTPSSDCDALPGITSRRVASLLRDLGVRVHETHIPVSDIQGFEAAFLTGTMIELRPIARIGDIELDPDHQIYEQAATAFSTYISGLT